MPIYTRIRNKMTSIFKGILTMNRQTIRTPRICTAGALPETAWPKVATIMIINSTPSEER
jgi:hypothetical protein